MSWLAEPRDTRWRCVGGCLAPVTGREADRELLCWRACCVGCSHSRPVGHCRDASALPGTVPEDVLLVLGEARCWPAGIIGGPNLLIWSNWVVLQGLVEAVGVSNYGPKQLQKIHRWAHCSGPLCPGNGRAGSFWWEARCPRARGCTGCMRPLLCYAD